MNVLSIPWGKIELKIAKKPEEPKVSHYTGRRNEANKSSKEAIKTILITVRGIPNVAAGDYKLAYSEGQQLKVYLRQLKLLHAGMHSAMYDTTCLDKGRVKSRYIPNEHSKILIVPPSVGVASQYQRTREYISSDARSTEVKLWR
jgi:hypothetical protein